MQLVFQIFIDKLRERGTAEAIDVIPPAQRGQIVSSHI